MDVEHRGDIGASTLFFACSELLSTVNEIAEEEDLPQDAGSLNAKVNLNSPGVIEFASAHPAVSVALVAVLVVFVVGGGLKVKIPGLGGFDMNLGGDGLITKISKFLSDRSERQLTDSMKQKLDALDVRDSKVILALLEKRSGKTKK
jgi:hypothetical protein